MSSSTPNNGSTPTNLDGFLNGGAGAAQGSGGQSLGTFFASLVGSLVLFGVQFGLFLIIKNSLARIYRPRTFLVPEKERTKSPPTGLWQWAIPVFQTSNSEFIQRCGLDAYFFLRYLRMLLRIFIPLAIVILPILLPINAARGRGPNFATGIYGNDTSYTNVSGLDQLGWGNVRPQKYNRYWAHLILAVLVVIYVCYVLFDELRGYIRLRQAYLTSPQHRLRASATTVLITGIPKKWCTVEALEGLYDVFPGGIRNIWINRNFDELMDKVDRRNKYALALESAETSLIKTAKKNHMERLKKDAKKAGKKQSKEEKIAWKEAAEKQGAAIAGGDGISSGNPHQVRHTLQDILDDSSGPATRNQSTEKDRKKPIVAIPFVGQGIEAFGHGIDNVGRSVFGGLKKIGRDIDERINTTGGLVAEADVQPDQSLHRISSMQAPADQVLASDPGAAIRVNQRDLDGASERTPLQPIARSDPAGSVTQPEKTYDDPSRHPSLGDPRNLDASVGTTSTIDQNRSIADPNAHESSPERGEKKNSAKDSRSAKDKWSAKDSQPPKSSWMTWKKGFRGTTFDIPSPVPHGMEEDEFPLSSPSPVTPGGNPPAVVNGPGSEGKSKGGEPSAKKINIPFFSKDEVLPAEYPTAYDEEFSRDKGGEPLWKQYVKEKERDTMRLPIFGWQWMPSLPLLGKKVDTIYYCREEVARLNVEIEQDQNEPERYPLMNSAFVQFNHQVAAHMACQAVSHHLPAHMSPRLVEISPDDVIWGNMAITWWERYIRTAVVLTVIAGLIIAWAIPVTFTGFLSKIKTLENLDWLTWLKRVPPIIISVIQGILPQALLAALLAILPLILRLLAKLQGVQTGTAVELTVQTYYFSFLFVQVFLVVSISSGVTTIIPELLKNPASVASLLAENIPKASDYFFSYMLLQALSTSAGALLQVGGLLGWFVLAPVFDSTAREKWSRQVNLPQTQWGTFFPVYTNLASIGLIYSVISPLILVFNIVTFGLFWIVYRYNTLYVTRFRLDTGGLLFPKAINQLFTGLYVMELCLVGLFFLVRESDAKGKPSGKPCYAQGGIMIAVFLLTITYQWLLNDTFSPLFRYLPITLEDDAVARDEEFARIQEKKWAVSDTDEPGQDNNPVVEGGERRSNEHSREDEAIEMQDIERHKPRAKLDPRNLGHIVPNTVGQVVLRKSWADRQNNQRSLGWLKNSPRSPGQQRRHRHSHHADPEALRSPDTRIGEALFSGLNEQIEDLTPDERDKLVQRAFQHAAIRAKRPVIWLPRDDLLVSDDEIRRTNSFSKNLWISNAKAGLDSKAKVVFKSSPPDFSEVDLIEL